MDFIKKKYVTNSRNDVVYQNKDVTAKVFAERFPKTSLKVYGIDTPRIVQLLPTNLPRIKANELRIDNLFLLEDGTLALLDYESTYKEEQKIKYMDYIVRVLHRYMKHPKKISMIVIYTADIDETQVTTTLDVDSIQLKIRPAFLSKLDSSKIRHRLLNKVENHLKLTDEELMEFIILPLTYQGIEPKKESIRELFEVAKLIEEEETQVFLLSGIIAFADKVIDQDLANQMKGWIGMTKVARLFEEEKMEAVREAVREAIARTKKEDEKAAKEATKKAAEQTVIKCLEEGFSVEKIAHLVSGTNLEEIKQLKIQMEMENKSQQ